MENNLYSFSKFETFNNCPRCYYYTYILDYRNGDNIYSFLGTVVHELIGKLELSKISKAEAENEFVDSIIDADNLRFKWISEKVKNNYIECVFHYLKNFQKTNCDEIFIEDYFETSINCVNIRGYIDAWYVKNNEIYIVDYKTSSKFSSVELQNKQKQLYIYAKVLKERFPNRTIYLGFDMVKYALQGKKIVERNKLNLLKPFKPAIIDIPFNEKKLDNLNVYIKTSEENIGSKIIDRPSDWAKSHNPNTGFFCKNLCSHRKRCLNYVDE